MMFRHFIYALTLWIATPALAAIGVDETTRLVQQAEKSVKDSRGWATDILDVLHLHGFEQSKENVCAVIAVVDQESGFVADPAVAELGKLSEKALREKFEKVPVAGSMALAWLETKPTPATNFIGRIRNARTERDLDLVYRAMVSYGGESSGLETVMQFGLFNRLIEERNEIDTAGSMQVSVKFAIEQARARRWLPMLLDDVYAVRDQLYTRHGGLYYGVAQLLGYDTGYDKKVYRFADFNAGRYASRNAAVQKMVARLSGENLAFDGDLLSYAKNGKPLPGSTSSERAIRAAIAKHKLGIDDQQLRRDLLLEKDFAFTSTKTYLALHDAYVKITGKKPPFAIVPVISLSSPKIRRMMTTQIFAETVAKRYQGCMAGK